MREPCEGKPSSTVLRREGTRKGSDLSNTVGKDAKKIKEYIEKQLKEDQLGEQLTFDNQDPFTGSK